VIGSGPGGAVAALRLTQAGIPVTIIERGRRWDVPEVPHFEQPFCRNFTPDGRAAWLDNHCNMPLGPKFPIKRYIGLIERVRNPNLDIMCGAAWGGTSVVTGMLSLVPTEPLFQRIFPSEISYREMTSVHYPRACEMLRPSTIPDDILDSATYRAMKVVMDQARKAGMGIKMIPTATDWDILRKELRGEIFRCGVDGELVYGNNSGWKHSVDRNYLKYAEATGLLTVVLQHRVTEIGVQDNGRYNVCLEALDQEGEVVRTSEMSCDKLFVCAGSYGTSALMVRARDKGMLPDLSPEVGEGFGNNGNVMFLRENVGADTGPNQGGPPSIGVSYLDHPIGPNFLEHAQFAAYDFSQGKLLHFSLCLNPTRGKFVTDATTDSVSLQWPADGNSFSREVATHTIDRLNDANGGNLANNPLIEGMIDGFTFHPLGGMVMGEATDLFGRVKGYRGLYTLDGSLIPGSSAAVNPLLTITANAERCVERILAEDG
jgi:cholesterol oxidase